MKYKNTVTGDVIEIRSKISGGPWQAIEPAMDPGKDLEVAPKKKPDVAAKKATKTKKGTKNG